MLHPLLAELRFFPVAIVLSISIAPVTAGTSNSLMDISTDGSWLVCSNRDSGTLSVVDLRSHQKVREIEVGLHPEGVSFLGKSHDVAVACYGEDRVLVFDCTTGKRKAEIEVFDEPYGVVSTRDGTRLFVTLEFPAQVLEINTENWQITRTTTVGKFLRGLALSANEQRLFTGEYYTGTVHSLDAATLQPLAAWPAASTDNLARQLEPHPSRDKLYQPHIRSRTAAAHGSGSIFPYVTVINPPGDNPDDDGPRRRRIPMDSFVGIVVTANPWEIAVAPDGQQLFVIFSGTDDMFVCNILDDNYRELQYRKRMATGRNPRTVRVNPANSIFYVYNALDFEVVGFDTQSLREVARIRVCDNPLDEQVHLGKVLFYTANPPLTSRRWISCSSCHPDGDSDARTWQNPEGLRNTPPLFGLGWTHPLHWSADRDEVQDFEHTIRGLLMQGRGLVRGSIHPALGQPNRRLSAELDALAAYTNSHKFSLSPFSKQGLSEQAQRGQKLFHSKATRCTDCHNGPFLSDSRPENQLVRHDVGTGGDDPSEKMGPKYDTPTLLGVYRSAPYLHHGKAATLQDVLKTHNQDDRHGKTSHLSQSEIDDLVAYLKALPFEAPEPIAKRQKMTRVVD